MLRYPPVGSRARVATHVVVTGSAVLAAAIAVAPLMASRLERTGGQRSAENPTSFRRSTADPIDLTLEGVDVSGPGGHGTSRLTADLIQVRRRSGAHGFVHYEDLREILVRRAVITMPVEEERGRMLAHVVPGARRLLPFVRAGERAGQERSEPGASMPRVRFEDFALHLSRPSGDTLDLQAATGQLNTGGRILILDGVRISISRGDSIWAPRAVFSEDLDGLRLPLGYVTNGQRAVGDTFLVVNDTNRFEAARDVPALDDADSIEKKERLVLAHLLERAPPALQPMLTLLVTGMATQDVAR